jgi:hypothetical protein
MDIEGGWRYRNDIAFILDRQELRELANNTNRAENVQRA